MGTKYHRVRTFQELQGRAQLWRSHNFPVNGTIQAHLNEQTLGVCEEAGELSHAVLKMSQGIRGSREDHVKAAEDAIGDIIIYLTGVCDDLSLSLEDCVNSAWKEVEMRDWQKNKEDGS